MSYHFLFCPLDLATYSLLLQTPVTVGGINNEMEEEVPIAVCGDNVRVRLRGVEDEDILTGFVLTSVEAPVHTVTQFEAQLVILDHKNIICAGYSAVMHVHTAAEEINLTVSLLPIYTTAVASNCHPIFSQALLHYFDKKTGKKSRKPPQFAKRGSYIPLFFIAEHQPTDLSVHLCRTKGHRFDRNCCPRLR